MKPFKAYHNLTHNNLDALLHLKDAYITSVIIKANTIQKLIHPNLLADLVKDNTWAVPTYLENKQMLKRKSICSQFVSSAFCKIAVKRFMKVEKLGSTIEFGKK